MTLLRATTLNGVRGVWRTGTTFSRRFASSVISKPLSPPKQMDGQIPALHALAVRQGNMFYADPETGLMVMTELASLKRGRCCGNACRHCAYGHSQVFGDGAKVPPITTIELEEQRAAGLIVEKPLPISKLRR